MPLLLLCGPANSGKVRSVIERFMADCREHGGAWLVVPTASDIDRARRELVGRSAMVLGARVGTFHHLVRELAGDPAVLEIDPPTEVVLVRRLLEASSRAGGLAFPGLARSTRRQLAELRSIAAVGEAALTERLSTLQQREQASWRELLAAWGEELVVRGLRDDAWHEAQAMQRLAQGREPLVPIHAYGFDDLTAAQVQLLVAASRRTDVSLSLPFVRGRLVFERRQALVDRFVAAGAQVIEQGDSAFRSPVLQQLEQRFYEPTAEPVLLDAAQPPAVGFVECCGDLQQAEQVVREVGRMVRAGIEPGQIACLTASPGRSRALLEAAFRRHRVPVLFDVPRTSIDTPSGRALLDLLDAVIARDVGRLAAFLHSRISGVDQGALLAWQRDLAQLASHASERALESAVVPAAVRRMWQLRPGDRSTAAIESLRELVTTSSPAQPGDVRLLAAVDELLTRVESACAAVPPSLIELRDAIASMPIPAPTRRERGHVVVAPITRVRTDRFDAVVVFDLHAGGFTPSGDDLDAPLIARELAYIAFTRAWSQVVFVRQAAAADGRPRTAHAVWHELRRLVPDAPVARRSLDEIVCAPEQVVFAGELGPALAAAVGDGELRLDQAQRLVPDLALEVAARSTDAGDQFRAELAEATQLRVTDVEGYAGCSARWFTQRHLLPRRGATSSRQVVGTLVHAALAELVPASVNRDRPTTAAEVEAAVARACTAYGDPDAIRPIDAAHARFVASRFLRDDKVLGEQSLSEVSLGADDGDQPPLLPQIELRGMRLSGRVDRIDISADGGAVLHDYKLGSSAPAANKLLAEGRLQLPLYWAAARASTRLQPVGALYRPLEGTRPRGVLDKALAPDVPNQFRTDRLDGELVDALIDEVLAEAGDTIDRIRSGHVAAEPRGGACPSWCELDSICRVGVR